MHQISGADCIRSRSNITHVYGIIWICRNSRPPSGRLRRGTSYISSDGFLKTLRAHCENEKTAKNYYYPDSEALVAAAPLSRLLSYPTIAHNKSAAIRGNLESEEDASVDKAILICCPAHLAQNDAQTEQAEASLSKSGESSRERCPGSVV